VVQVLIFSLFLRSGHSCFQWPFTPQLKHLPGFCPCVNLSVAGVT
jgi:hypothetical protein